MKRISGICALFAILLAALPAKAENIELKAGDNVMPTWSDFTATFTPTESGTLTIEFEDNWGLTVTYDGKTIPVVQNGDACKKYVNMFSVGSVEAGKTITVVENGGLMSAGCYVDFTPSGETGGEEPGGEEPGGNPDAIVLSIGENNLSAYEYKAVDAQFTATEAGTLVISCNEAGWVVTFNGQTFAPTWDEATSKQVYTIPGLSEGSVVTLHHDFLFNGNPTNLSFIPEGEEPEGGDEPGGDDDPAEESDLVVGDNTLPTWSDFSMTFIPTEDGTLTIEFEDNWGLTVTYDGNTIQMVQNGDACKKYVNMFPVGDVKAGKTVTITENGGGLMSAGCYVDFTPAGGPAPEPWTFASVTPSEGEVASITSISLSYSSDMTGWPDGGTMASGIIGTFTTPDGAQQEVFFGEDFDITKAEHYFDEMTAPGTYTLTIAAGAAQNKAGVDNAAMTYTWTIPAAGEETECEFGEVTTSTTDDKTFTIAFTEISMITIMDDSKVTIDGTKVSCGYGAAFNEVVVTAASTLAAGQHTIVFPAGSLSGNSANAKDIKIVFTIGGGTIDPTPGGNGTTEKFFEAGDLDGIVASYGNVTSISGEGVDMTTESFYFAMTGEDIYPSYNINGEKELNWKNNTKLIFTSKTDVITSIVFTPTSSSASSLPYASVDKGDYTNGVWTGSLAAGETLTLTANDGINIAKITVNYNGGAGEGDDEDDEDPTIEIISPAENATISQIGYAEHFIHVKTNTQFAQFYWMVINDNDPNNMLSSFYDGGNYAIAAGDDIHWEIVPPAEKAWSFYKGETYKVVVKAYINPWDDPNAPAAADSIYFTGNGIEREKLSAVELVSIDPTPRTSVDGIDAVPDTISCTADATINVEFNGAVSTLNAVIPGGMSGTNTTLATAKADVTGTKWTITIPASEMTGVEAYPYDFTFNITAKDANGLYLDLDPNHSDHTLDITFSVSNTSTEEPGGDDDDPSGDDDEETIVAQASTSCGDVTITTSDNKTFHVTFAAGYGLMSGQATIDGTACETSQTGADAFITVVAEEAIAAGDHEMAFPAYSLMDLSINMNSSEVIIPFTIAGSTPGGDDDDEPASKIIVLFEAGVTPCTEIVQDINIAKDGVNLNLHGKNAYTLTGIDSSKGGAITASKYITFTFTSDKYNIEKIDFEGNAGSVTSPTSGNIDAYDWTGSAKTYTFVPTEVNLVITKITVYLEGWDDTDEPGGDDDPAEESDLVVGDNTLPTWSDFSMTFIPTEDGTLTIEFEDSWGLTVTYDGNDIPMVQNGDACKKYVNMFPVGDVKAGKTVTITENGGGLMSAGCYVDFTPAGGPAPEPWTFASVTPAEGEVTSITSIALNYSSDMTGWPEGGTMTSGITGIFTTPAGEQEVFFGEDFDITKAEHIFEEMTAPGTYTLTIAAGTTQNKAGVDNAAMTYTWTIAAAGGDETECEFGEVTTSTSDDKTFTVAFTEISMITIMNDSEVTIDGTKVSCGYGAAFNEVIVTAASTLAAGQHTIVFPAGSLMGNSANANDIKVVFTIGGGTIDPTPGGDGTSEKFFQAGDLDGIVASYGNVTSISGEGVDMTTESFYFAMTGEDIYPSYNINGEKELNWKNNTKLIFTSKTDVITSIVFTPTSSSTSSLPYVSTDKGSYDNGVWTGTLAAGESVTFTANDGINLAAITVNYNGGAGEGDDEDDEDPTIEIISPAENATISQIGYAEHFIHVKTNTQFAQFYWMVINDNDPNNMLSSFYDGGNYAIAAGDDIHWEIVPPAEKAWSFYKGETYKVVVKAYINPWDDPNAPAAADSIYFIGNGIEREKLSAVKVASIDPKPRTSVDAMDVIPDTIYNATDAIITVEFDGAVSTLNAVIPGGMSGTNTTLTTAKADDNGTKWTITIPASEMGGVDAYPYDFTFNITAKDADGLSLDLDPNHSDHTLDITFSVAEGSAPGGDDDDDDEPVEFPAIAVVGDNGDSNLAGYDFNSIEITAGEGNSIRVADGFQASDFGVFTDLNAEFAAEFAVAEIATNDSNIVVTFSASVSKNGLYMVKFPAGSLIATVDGKDVANEDDAFAVFYCNAPVVDPFTDDDIAATVSEDNTVVTIKFNTTADVMFSYNASLTISKNGEEATAIDDNAIEAIWPESFSDPITEWKITFSAPLEEGQYVITMPVGSMNIGMGTNTSEHSVAFTIIADGIRNALMNNSDSCYTINGQKVQFENANGILIVNGKKVLVK